MKMIHTSDWHLGNRMLDHARTDEFRCFLDWLLTLLEQEHPDVLLVSGDIFDTTTPGEGTREMYCDFLSRADAMGCGQVIITAGNHDGVAQLEVSRPLLRRHHCTVVTHLKPDEAANCLVPVCGEDGRELGLVCALPFLRPGEVSLPQTEEERELSYVRGEAALYQKVASLAEAWKAEHPGLPVVAMGHLPVQGTEVTASTRSLLGTLDVVTEDIFADVFDYVALGHIHKPSENLNARVLYCGSPLAMGMDEAAYTHHVLVVELGVGKREVRAVPVPPPVHYVNAECHSREELETLVARLRASEAACTWLSLAYHAGDLSTPQLNDLLRAELSQERVPIIRAAHIRPLSTLRKSGDAPVERLTDYTPERVFRRRLEEFLEKSPETVERREELFQLFNTVLSDIQSN